MGATDNRNQRGWRRLIGWGAAYLLVFHLGFAGASTAHFFAQASDAADGTAFCLSGGGGPASPADAPAGQSHGKIHCVLCTGGGSLALSPAEVFAAPRLILASALVPASEQAPRQSRRRSPQQSRAPPLEV